MAWESLQTLGNYTLATYNGTIPTRQDYVDPANCTVGNTPLCTSVTDNPDFNHYVFNIGTDYFIDYKFKSSQQNFIDTTYVTQVGGLGTYKVESCDLGFAVDHSIHEAKAMLFIYYKSSAQASIWCSLVCPEGYGTTENRQALYTVLINYHEYTWQSVSSISGKNGVLSLSTINDSAINNGNPVTGATSDTFHSTEDSKVEELVTYATPIDSSKLESFTCIYQATPPFAALKLLVKKNSAPQDEEDADLVINLPNPVLSTGVDEYTATNLDPLTNYFCVVQVSDNGGHYKYSDPAEVRTGFMDRNFDYTGAIQTFTAPKTGIYSLETWGAQGGDATDGTNTARGGYGAYAYGEVLLQQGETIYINVGGQNGYGGGGIPPVVPPEYQAQIDQINGDSGSGYDFYWKSYTTWDGSHLVEAPFDNYSWSKKADESQDLIIDGRPFDTRYMYPNTKFDVYIDGEGSSYQLKLHDYQGREDGVNWSSSRAYKCYANTTQMVGATPSTSYSYDYFLNNYVYYTGTISGCLDYIIANFRNVNIYVNGVQWASV